jgi:hypothetical protein
MPERAWGVLAIKNVLSGRGDIDNRNLRRALDEGWEPFAVADGHIWLKKQEPLKDA